MIVQRRRFLGVAAAVALATAIGAPGASGSVTRQAELTFDGSNGLGQPVVTAAVDNSNGPNLRDVYTGLASGVVLRFDEIGAYTGLKITGKKTPQKSFSLVKAPFTSDIAVDSSGGETAGDVYVADIEHGVVDRFDTEGRYVCQITGSATPSKSECDTAEGGTPAGSMEPRGLAVDSSGDVYVADVAHNVIDEFGPGGEYLGQLADPGSDPGPLAVNKAGDVYVANGGAGTPTGIVELAPGGSVVPRPELEAAPAVSVAVDPASGDVLVGEQLFGISEYTPSGGKVASFGAGGAALAPGTEHLYANASTEPTITTYGLLETIPEVSTATATGVAAESATLNGEVTPDAREETTGCDFEYGTTTVYGAEAPCEPVANPGYTEATSVSVTVKLAPSTTYHFRIKAQDQRGKTHSADETFKTPALVPVAPVISDEAANPSVTQATVRAEIAPGGSEATCQLQFVEEAQFKVSEYAGAASAPCSGSGLGAGYSAQRALAQLSGLRTDTIYHYRFLATNVSGTSTGEDRTLATFGVNAFSATVLDREGHPYTQAGGHPYKLVTNFEFNVGIDANGHRATNANPRDIVTALPPGYIGNVNATPRCTASELVRDRCSPDAQVGVIHLRLDSEHEEEPEPLYNVVPPSGYPAALGFRIKTFVSVFILFKVRTGGDYGIDAESLDSSTAAGLEGATVEVWGVPGDPSHDDERECGAPEHFERAQGCSIKEPVVPFLTNPTSCSGPQTETLRADSWQDPGNFVTATTTLPAITGCSVVPFTPKASVQPTTSTADSPTGLATSIEVPQEEGPDGVEQSQLNQAVVTLPQGMTVSPAGANGLEACSPKQISLSDASEPSCPNASKIGTVEIETPVLPDTVKGSVYVAQQNANPFGSTLAIYLYAQADGAVVKLAGHVSADPVTGQLTTTFNETPQLPFKSLRLVLDSGPRAPLATPESCGAYATQTSLTPWSGARSLIFSSPFEISSGCVGGFAPSFSAGSMSEQAGAFSPFVLSFSRSDTEQEPVGLTATLPPGLVAKLTGVPLCADANANAGTCPEAARVGTVQASAGPGPDPLTLNGSAYLTGPYKGAPYGLAVEVPAIAGPFNLGTVVVRQALHIDPNDAHVTAVSDPFPTILDLTGANGQTDGFPVRLRSVDVAIDRAEFTLNPTNCAPMAIGATFVSKEGASVAESSPFQIANCASLPFKPTLTAEAVGHGSKANGTSFHVNVTSAGVGQANIAKVDLTLPLALSSRLSTLQLACREAAFNGNPASCPAGSVIGSATIHTPILSNPLTGPAYLVSHGGAAFPDVEFVLQGDGVEIVLDGKTDIKAGITYSKFESAPDAPFTSFETELPAGPHSILTPNVPEKEEFSLCKQTLAMPTAITGQNGAVIDQDTSITVTGCGGVLPSKTVKPTRAQELAKALKACRSKYKHKKNKRLACEKQARNKYGPIKKTAHKSSHTGLKHKL